MATTSLGSAPVFGTLTSSGSSPVFSTTANTPAFVVVGLSRLASSAMPTLMRSTDGGSTWAAIPFLLPGPAFNQGFPALSTFYSAALLDDIASQYRIDISLSGGSIIFYAMNCSPSFHYCHVTCSIVEQNDPNGSVLSATTDQLLRFYSARNVPLNSAAIAAPLTIYKRLDPTHPSDPNNPGSPLVYAANLPAIAKLSVPSGALLGFDNTNVDVTGVNRAVRASTVQVVSVTDSNNNALSSGHSWIKNSLGNTTTYTVGSIVNAVDLAAANSLPPSAGAFDGATCFYGIHGFTTLAEAVFGFRVPINLPAYGL